MQPRAPSGLFPSGPPRPSLREPHPVRATAILVGAAMAGAWLLAFGLLATSIVTYVWLTLSAAVVAVVCALVLVRFGDRGAAVGVAMATGIGVAIAMSVVAQNWFAAGWPLW